jgi:hypothetical protein
MIQRPTVDLDVGTEDDQSSERQTLILHCLKDGLRGVSLPQLNTRQARWRGK